MQGRARPTRAHQVSQSSAGVTLLMENHGASDCQPNSDIMRASGTTPGAVQSLSFS
jgi:hypothetical protein